MKKNITIVSICSLLGFSGFGSGPHPMSNDQCRAYFSTLDGRTSQSIADLAPWLDKKGRAPAAVKSADREEWRRWAIRELKELQLLSDDAKALGGRPEFQRLLAEISNEMVHFHGQTNVGGVQKMSDILEGIRARIRKALLKGSCT
ncbi:hypothetical protein WDW86_20540 [Bdellovibrionota bacterium FG-2]